jgi:DNA-binding transcriptional regulator YhcF (GntR family)
MAPRGVYERPYQEIAARMRDRIVAGRWLPGDRLPTLAELQAEYGRSKNTIVRALAILQAEGRVVTRGKSHYVQEAGPLPEPAARPEHQPVVAAVVTSHLGEIEPGESQVDAAIREVKEETGLDVRAGHQEIGRRVHPATGRTMIYLACTPVRSTDAVVGDPEELAEVRWLSLAEVDDLMPGVFEPVREHLGRVIS